MSEERTISVADDGSFERPPTRAELADAQPAISIPTPPAPAPTEERIRSSHDGACYFAVVNGNVVQVPGSAVLPPGARWATLSDLG